MTRRTPWSALTALFTVLMLLTGCGANGSPESSPTLAPSNLATGTSKASYSGTEFPMIITDFDGKESVIESKPERVVILTGTALNIWYDAGGEAVATTSLSENVKLTEEHAERMRALPDLGPIYAVNQEQVVAQDPDLVITMAAQNELAEQLRAMGIPTMAVKITSFADLTMAYEIFGALNETTDQARSRIETITAETQQVIDRWPADGSSVVILFVTAQSLSVKLDSSIAGHMLTTLGVTNIASGTTPENPGSENTPLDVEYIVANQPDQVLVTSMISSNEEAKAKIDAEFTENSAWQAVDAVREGKVSYLPQQYFLYNAGPYYAEALEYLAACLRPDVYGDPVAP